MTPDAPPTPHRIDLQFDFSDRRLAERVVRSVDPEADGLDADRARVTVRVTDASVAVAIAASDLTALRAATNTWTTLIDVAIRAGTAD